MCAAALLFTPSSASAVAVSSKLPFCHRLPATSHHLKVNLTVSPSTSSYRFSRIPSSIFSFSNSAGPMAASAGFTSSAESKPFAVLFVCLGNICRSPAAEAVFRSLVTKRALDSRFTIDSAGTIAYHQGEPADPRMRDASKRRGIEVTSISRPVRPPDFTDFDLILAMDKRNKDDILAAYEGWRNKESLPENAQQKVKLVCSYCRNHSETEVPDPYYGGPQGFEKVLNLLEDACESLLDSILAENI